MKPHNRRTVLWLLLAITGIFLIISLPYITTGTAFILGWDMRTIYSSNFENLRTMVTAWKETGTLPYWSWVNFLGNDFYSSKLFYFNDFFEYFFAFTDLPYTTAIIWMTYLRYITAGLSFYAYCRYRKYSDYTSVLGSLLFTFSVYLIQIMRDPFFASFISFLPLYFLSVDRYIRERKPFFFVFMVFFLFLNSYYLFYMTSLFTILYFILRWNQEYDSHKGMWKHAFYLIGYYLVGFMISGMIVIPEILNIIGNSRVGERSAVLLYESLVPYLNYLSGLFTPTSVVAYRTDTISNLYLYDTPNHQLMAVYVWAGSVCAILFPQLFVHKQTRKRSIIVTLLVSAFALIPILSSIMHGFSEPSFRWMANVTFLLVSSVLPFIEDMHSINKKVLNLSYPVIALLLAVTPWLFASLLGVSGIQVGYVQLLACIPTILITGIALAKEHRPLLLGTVIVELSLVSFLSCYANPSQNGLKKTDADRMTTIMGEKNYFNEWTLTLDPDNEHSFYRSYIDPQAVYFGRGTNYNLDANIRGLMAYDSTYLASTNDLVALDPEQVIDYLPWTFNIQNPYIMNLVSTKYAITGADQPSPFLHGELIGHYADTWNVYLNQDYINLGKTYRSIMNEKNYDPSLSSEITSTIICKERDYEELKSLIGNEEVQCYSAYAEGNHVSAGLLTSESGVAVLSVPFDEGWTVTVNGHKTNTYSVNGGMIGIAVEAGENDIQMWFSPKGLNIGKTCTIAGILLCAGLVILQIRSHKN
ncbi:MAG: YfhO family protein [Solobacterium sp.]|nr:YfhO family protein [Solobacterium sp.]